MMAYRRKQLPALGLALLVLVGCSRGVDNGKGNETPPAPPALPVIATGNGTLVGGHLGPQGGRLNLGPDGPGVALPAGTTGPQGLSISVLQDSDAGVPAGVRRLGPPFRVSRPVDAPSGQHIEVSMTLPALPAGCTAADVRLAVETPASPGLTPGPHTSALQWVLEPVRVQAGQAVARLPRLWGMRLQFLCGTGS